MHILRIQALNKRGSPRTVSYHSSNPESLGRNKDTRSRGEFTSAQGLKEGRASQHGWNMSIGVPLHMAGCQTGVCDQPVVWVASVQAPRQTGLGQTIRYVCGCEAPTELGTKQTGSPQENVLQSNQSP